MVSINGLIIIDSEQLAGPLQLAEIRVYAVAEVLEEDLHLPQPGPCSGITNFAITVY